MLNAPQIHVHNETPLPMIAATKVEIDQKTILLFSVNKGVSEIYQLPDGRCVRRKDKQTLPVTFKQIHFERQEVRSREYDRDFVDGAVVTDLDLPLLQSIADTYLRGISVERYLQQIGLAEYAGTGLRLRRATLLLFASDIQRWHPRSEVRILKVAGTSLKSGEQYNVISDEIVRGNSFGLLTNAWEQLRPYLAYKTEFGSEAKFEQKHIYPEWACREALVNAIAHRDYSAQNGIEVYIYNDRMEIRNPGALLSTLTIESLTELQGAHESRNVLIARVLRENNIMRELGEGVKRIFHLMEESELDTPKLSSNRTSFSVTLPNKPIFTDQQEEWLKLFARQRLSPHQKKIVLLGMGGNHISTNDIYKAINTTDRDIYDREVTQLRRLEILEQIRNQQQTSNYARSHRISKKDVPRFRVNLPKG